LLEGNLAAISAAGESAVDPGVVQRLGEEYADSGQINALLSSGAAAHNQKSKIAFGVDPALRDSGN
jgi:hypothetical protein